MRTVVPPFSTTTLQHTLISNHRGNYQFGSIYFRYVCPLGLVKRQGWQKSEDEVKVYPNLLDIRKYDLIHKRSHLLETGIKRSLLRGEGTDFESLRDYVPDDDIRWVDWKSTARHDYPISKNYQVERMQNLLLLIDAGRMMAAQVGTLTKLDQAINTSLLLGYVAIRQADQVGMLTFADDIISFLPPRKQLNYLMEALYPLEVRLSEPNYSKVACFLSLKHRKRSLIVIFTDLSNARLSSSLLSCVSSLIPQHLPLIVAISDPHLIATSQIMPQEPLSIYEKAVANQLLLEREQLLHQLTQKGALALDVPVEELSVAVINKYLEVKSKGRL